MMCWVKLDWVGLACGRLCYVWLGFQCVCVCVFVFVCVREREIADIMSLLYQGSEPLEIIWLG